MTDERPTAAAPSPLSIAGLGLVSLSMLTLQVALTRVFSLLLWYHFAFLAVALALLGFTAGGVWVQRSPALRARASGPGRARLSYGLAISIVVALFIACHLPFYESVLVSATQFFYFLVLLAALLVPFVISGVVISATIAEAGEGVGGLYFANLVGSGLGCVVSLAALDGLGGGPSGVLVAALAASLGGMCFAGASAGREGLAQGAGIGAACLLLLGLSRDPMREPFYVPNAKVYPRVPKEMMLTRRCTSVACVDFFQNPLHFGLWGIARNYTGPQPEQIGVVIDAWAITSIVKADRLPDGRAEMRHPVFEALPPSLVFEWRRATGRGPASALVIGAGGGLDVRGALHFGASHVDAVDINPTILDAVQRDFDVFSGGLYRRPDVHVVHAEGRHFLRRSPRAYDVIQISGVDTFAASQAGAFALSENYLYTVEALTEYLEHLSPDGTLSFTRWLYHPPRQTLRLCVIADEALRRLGERGARERLVVVAARVPGAEIDFSVVLVRRAPFSAEELAALRDQAEQRGFEVVYSPDGRSPPSPFSDYFSAADPAAYVRAYPFQIDASTDDRPFFFEHNRFSRLFQSRDSIFGAASGQLVLLVTFLLVALSGVFFLRSPRGESAAPMRPAWQGYFVLLGAGFMGTEMVFVPRFVLYLGNPSYALSVVLFALLSASGLGAALSPRLVTGGPGRLRAALLGVAALLGLYEVLLSPVFAATLRFAFLTRAGLSCALVGAPALLMGMAFPAALGRATRAGASAGWVARAWVLNGYASVVTSVGAVIVAMTGGFSLLLFLSLACYAAAAWAAGAPRYEPGGGRAVTET